jgi:hypothetical protein
MATGQTAPNFGKRLTHNWRRWYTWLFCLGLGFYGGQFAALALQGHVFLGIATLLGGTFAYAVGSLFLAVVPALVAASIPAVRLFPTTLVGGVVRVLVIGLVLGILFVNTKPSESTTVQGTTVQGTTEVSCTDENVDAQFAKFKALDDALRNRSTAPRKLVSQADGVWQRDPDCILQNEGLSPSARADFYTVLIVGSADSVLVYFDAKQYGKARKHLGEYRGITMATQGNTGPGWKELRSFEDQAAPDLKTYDEEMTRRGFPPS